MASDIKVNNIKSYTGNTLNLGDTGDTINLTGTSFNGTSSVIWDTTPKTTAFTATAGTGYFVNTTSGVITATLPSSPSAGDIVAFKDYAGTFGTNNLTIARNGENIQGNAENNSVSTNRASVVLVYVDATKGWLYTVESNIGDLGPQYLAATGGTITTSGDYKIHTFTSSGTFTVTNAGNILGSNTVDYLVVAGGGGGGSSGPGGKGGGGGAGGFRESVPNPAAWTASPLANPGGSLPVSVQGYPITVGAGGTGGSFPGPDSVSGGSSIFSTITSAGGGRAGMNIGSGSPDGGSGGSGGGGGGDSGLSGTGGSGNTPNVSPPQGSNGGDSVSSPSQLGGGGGGATGAGGTNSAGAGATSNISATSTTYSEGGQGFPSPNASGSSNSGDGGEGTRQTSPAGSTSGSGGSGVVIIRYKFQ